MRRHLWFIVIWYPRKWHFSTYAYKNSVRIKVILSADINKGAWVIANRSKDVQYILTRSLTSKKISNEDARMHWVSRRPTPNWVLLPPFCRKHGLYSNRTLTKMQIIKKVVHCQKKARRVLMVTTCQKKHWKRKNISYSKRILRYYECISYPYDYMEDKKALYPPLVPINSGGECCETYRFIFSISNRK